MKATFLHWSGSWENVSLGDYQNRERKSTVCTKSSSFTASRDQYLYLILDNSPQYWQNYKEQKLFEDLLQLKVPLRLISTLCLFTLFLCLYWTEPNALIIKEKIFHDQSCGWRVMISQSREFQGVSSKIMLHLGVGRVWSVTS